MAANQSFPQAKSETGSPFDKRYKFSPEELEILKECNSESFFYRSIPCAALFAAGTHYAVKNGIFGKMHPRWGSTFKVIGASLLGVLVGKTLYIPTCQKKFEKLPNSKIGEMLRKKKQSPEMMGSDSTFSSSSQMQSYDTDKLYTNLNENTQNVEIDPDKNIIYGGLDDSNRPTFNSESNSFNEEQPIQRAFSSTYDDLRQKNRHEHDKKKYESYKNPPSPPTTHAGNSPTNSHQRVERKVTATNIYGDVLER